MLWFKIHPHQYYNARSISQSPYSLVAKTNQRVLFCFFYLWKASTELISLCYAKLSCYVTHSKKLNIIRLNSKMLKYELWDEERLYEIWWKLYSENNRLCVSETHYTTIILAWKQISQRPLWRSQCNPVRLSAWTWDGAQQFSRAYGSRAKTVSVSLYFTSQMCTQLFISPIFILQRCSWQFVMSDLT